MQKYYFIVTSLIFLCLSISCNYKAGNRGSELNYDMRITLNSFYVKKFLKQNYSVSDSISIPLNSELKNYPEQFFILKDTINRYYYVVETSITSDSMSIQEWGLSLSSIYDDNKQKWIYSRDSLPPETIGDFRHFFEENVLKPTTKVYSQKVGNDHLFSEGQSEAKILEIR